MIACIVNFEHWEFFRSFFSDEKLIFFVKEREAVPRTCSEAEPG